MKFRRVKDYIEIRDYASIDDLIEQLTKIRDQLPADCEAELKLKGDDIFGRKLCIGYFRLQTAEEVELDKKYNGRSKPNRPK